MAWASPLLLAFPSRPAAQDRWMLLNPRPTAEDMVGMDFPTPEVGIVVGKLGIVMRTGDGGRTWARIRVGRSDTLWAVQFPSARDGYIVGSLGTSLRTRDGGLTWEYRWTGTTRSLRSVYFTSRDTGHAAGDSGTLLRTVDAGATWTPRAAGTVKNFNRVRFGSRLAGIALAVDSVGAYTTDGGETWTPVKRVQGGTPMGLHMRDAKVGLAAYGGYRFPRGNHVIERTEDGGATWTTVHTNSAELSSLGFVHPDTGFVLGDSGTLVSTTDGGRTWTSSKGGPGHFALNAHFIDARQWLFLGTVGNMFLTRDAGRSWLPLTSGPRGYLEGVHFPTPADGYAVGLDGLILKTKDAGWTWNRLDARTGRSFRTAFFLDSDRGFVAGMDGYIHRTWDGGATWDSLATSSSYPIQNLEFPNTTAGYAIQVNGFVNRTADGGRTWSLAGLVPGTGSITVNSGRFPTADTGYVVGYHFVDQVHQAMVFATFDSGRTWTPRHPGRRGLLHKAYFLDGRQGFVSGNVEFNGWPGLFFRTRDAGITWDSVPLPPGTSSPMAMRFEDLDHGMIIMPGGIRYRTEDGGRTWRQENTDPIGYTMAAYCLEMENCYVVGPYSIHRWVAEGVVSVRPPRAGPEPTARPAAVHPTAAPWRLRWFDILGRLLPANRR